MTFKCEICGTPITASCSARRRFCSRACKGTWMSSLAGPTHWNWRGVQRECVVCHATFFAKKCHVERGIALCCSAECRRIKRTQMRGPANNNWQGGFTRDSKMLWEQRSRAKRCGAGGDVNLTQWLAMKEGFAFTCPSCGEVEPDILLTMDHVIPFCAGGQHKIDNVQPLCLHCNAVKHVKIVRYFPDKSKFEVRDFEDLVVGIAKSFFPLEYVRPNQDALNELADLMRGDFNIPGVIAHPEGAPR